jgi:hypothetical protein
VTTFGVLNIVFAVLGVFGIMALIAMLNMSGAPDNPVIKLMRENPVYVTWIKISIPLGLLTIAALLTAGIGLLRLKAWARVLSIVYAIWTLVNGLCGLVLNYLFLVRPLMEEAARKPSAESAGAMGGAVGSVFGGCFGMIYPVLLLIFMTRPKVIAAFRPAASEPPPLPPV